MRSTIVGSVLLIALILAATVWALVLFQGVGLMSPEEALPPDTQLVLRVPDVPKLVRRLSRADPESDPTEVQWNLMADLMERLLLSHGVRMSPSSNDIERLMSGEAIAALIPDGENGGSLALILDVGHGSEETINRARSHLEEIPASAGGLWSVRRHRGLEYATWRPAGGGLLCVTGLRGLSILATSVESMRKILDTLDGGLEPLLSDPDYRNIRSRIDNHSPVQIYAAGSRLRSSLEAILSLSDDGSSRNLAHLLGLDSMKAAGLSVDMARGLFMERLFIAMEAHDRGLLGELFGTSPRRTKLSALAPADMPYSLTLSLTSLDAVTMKLPAIVGGSSREKRRGVRDRLSGLEDFLALSLEKDIFATLGDNLVLSYDPPEPTGASGANRTMKEILLGSRAIASISVRRKEGLRDLLDRVDGLARALSVFDRLDQDGRWMTTYRFAAMQPMAPSYTLDDNHLLAATSPELLEKAIAASARKESLADQQEVRSLLRTLPDKVHLLFIADTQRLARSLHAQGGSLPSIIPWRFHGGSVSRGEHRALERTALAFRLGRSGLLVESVAPISPFLMAYARLENREARRKGSVAID